MAKVVMDRGGLQKSIKAIVNSCKIHKSITPHSLRHCYGAHLVEAGLNLRAIQQEMGHECPKTTALYTQLTDVTHGNTDAVINKLIRRLRITLDGLCARDVPILPPWGVTCIIERVRATWAAGPTGRSGHHCTRRRVDHVHHDHPLHQ